jgi:hypothetical protein
MKTLRRSMILAAVLLAAVVQQASAQKCPVKFPILLGTTGACNNEFQGGPCTTTSRLVQLDPRTGALVRDIGPVGFTVNGLAWDATSGKLYATTPPGDVIFHGLIIINPLTGRGKPVDKHLDNFGLQGDPSPIHSITIDAFGHMVGWYDEFPPPPGVTDTYVRINQRTGVATESPNTGINTSQNGLSFGEFNLLWNIDAPRGQPDGTLTQTAYIINPFDGKPFFSRRLLPPTAAALGDFHPGNNLYYGLSFDTSTGPPFQTDIVVVDPLEGTVTALGRTVDDLHTLAFVKGLW